MVSEQKLYAIREVSAMTGVNPVTLRAWQRRYGLVLPQRTPKGHRLYTEADIERIRQILAWLDKGVSIGQVKPLLAGAKPPATESDTLPEMAPLLTALESLNRLRCLQLLDEAFRLYPFAALRRRLIDPVERHLVSANLPMAAVQQALWQGVVIERCALSLAAQRQGEAGEALMLAFGAPGDRRTWLRAVALAGEGYRVTLLDGLAVEASRWSAGMPSGKWQAVAVVGEHQIQGATLKELTDFLQRQARPLAVFGSIAEIHAEVWQPLLDAWPWKTDHDRH